MQLAASEAATGSEVNCGDPYQPVPPGDVFVGVDVTISNVGDPDPVPLLATGFSVVGSDSNIYGDMATKLGYRPTGACGSNSVMVGTGGTQTCLAVFELPTGVTPSRVKYVEGNVSVSSAVQGTPAQMACSLGSASNCIICTPQF